jgi:hypothetical protein
MKIHNEAVRQRETNIRHPAKEPVKEYEILVIPGRGRSPRARNPRTQASSALGMVGVNGFRA